MEVLERFRQGDLEAFESLFQEFQGEVYGWIVSIVRDRGIAEDLTVETFWRIYRAHARFDPGGNFPAWARRIATNAALDHLKIPRREVALPDNLAAAAQPDPAVHREVHEQIERAFRELPARLQVATILALVEEKSYEQIAEALGISVGAAKSRVFRAVRLLRRKLKALGMEP